ncbi:hypothetical protein E5676_scaffold145G00100 [Cucumis melo var. makuwa]|uniref:Uncharacterized protein n=1 Tax=Cucumis melo var. makuwa TaxID=1194695 RepID=A0A5D3BX01_CUCMM|nr:hypothetical protein E6C27_scaffold128G002890 [Cucumis melo var. makuwa]TYK02756.1 hypothetical protein E5676_scaffold145G00100 [Cucumis melo var. makuwa]
MNELKTQTQELKTQLQEIREPNEILMGLTEQNAVWNDVQFRSALRYLHGTICNIIPIPEVPTKISRPLMRYNPEVRRARNCSQPPRQP